MIGKRRVFSVLVSCAVSCILLSSAVAQDSGTGPGVIAPPTGGSETIAIPQTENVEVLPVPPQNAGTQQTTTESGQQLAPLPLLSATPPTSAEQPLAPAPEETLPGIAPENVSGTAQTSPALEPLSPSLPPLEQQPPAGPEQQPSAELPPAPLAPMTGETTAPAGPEQQPSAELPMAPLAPMTGETTAPAGPEQNQPPAATAVPLAPAGEVQIPAPAQASQPQPGQMQPLSAAPASTVPGAPMPEQTMPAPAPQVSTAPPPEQVTRPPHIVPGEVLRGMPAYVNVQTTHVVKPGEDLHWIAAVYYGNAQLWKKIYEANKRAIKDPNHLKVGTTLVIPPQ